jgi:hypothetical protein
VPEEANRRPPTINAMLFSNSAPGVDFSYGWNSRQKLRVAEQRESCTGMSISKGALSK